MGHSFFPKLDFPVKFASLESWITSKVGCKLDFVCDGNSTGRVTPF